MAACGQLVDLGALCDENEKEKENGTETGEGEWKCEWRFAWKCGCSVRDLERPLGIHLGAVRLCVGPRRKWEKDH